MLDQQFAEPQTPPRGTRSKANARVSDKFDTPFTPKKQYLPTPSTSTRKRPRTPFKRLEADGAQRELFKKDNMWPVSPNTPKSSPIKKDLLKSLLAEDKSLFGIFLPAPSTIGSGRRHRKRKLLVIELPETPGKQIINEKLVNHWHNKSFNTGFSSDEEDMENIKRVEPVNPFVDSNSSKSDDPFKVSKPKTTLGTHVEYINHITGERKLVELSEEQQKIKPKRFFVPRMPQITFVKITNKESIPIKVFINRRSITKDSTADIAVNQRSLLKIHQINYLKLLGNDLRSLTQDIKYTALEWLFEKSLDVILAAVERKRIVIECKRNWNCTLIIPIDYLLNLRQYFEKLSESDLELIEQRKIKQGKLSWNRSSLILKENSFKFVEEENEDEFADNKKIVNYRLSPTTVINDSSNCLSVYVNRTPDQKITN